MDVAYEYNINSDAPTYPVNLLADANSLAAYIEGYGGQATAPVPADLLPPGGTDHPCGTHTSNNYVLNPDGSIASATYLPNAGGITYVTIKSDGLPLVAPLRSVPGGEVVADAVEPVLTELVNWGYQDGRSIPTDPSKTQPMGLLPPQSLTTATLNALPGAAQQGAQAAQDDLSSGSLLPAVSKPSTSSTTLAKPALPKLALPNSALDLKTGNKVFPKSGVTAGSAAGTARPGQKALGDAGSALGGLADNLKSGVQKAATARSAADPSTP